MSKKLKCVASYRNEPRGLVFKPGDVIDVGDEEYRFLMADAPGCFKQGRVIKDKMVKAPKVDK